MAATQTSHRQSTSQRQIDIEEQETRMLRAERDTLLGQQADDEAARGLECCNGALPAAFHQLEASSLADIEKSKWHLTNGLAWVAHGAPSRHDGGFWLTVDQADPVAGGAYRARMFVPAASVVFVEVLEVADLSAEGPF